MIDARNGLNGNPFDENLDSLALTRFTPTKNYDTQFIKIPIVIACTVLVFVLLIAGTATTAISFPPQPPQWSLERWEAEDPKPERLTSKTALDGDYKLLGPLLIMAGGFLLIVDVVMCTFLVREAYYSSRRVGSAISSSAAPMSVMGGPFFLAVQSNNDQRTMTPFAFSRQLWTVPNAPLPDFSLDGVNLKGLGRPGTATLTRCQQPPFNPDTDIEKETLSD